MENKHVEIIKKIKSHNYLLFNTILEYNSFLLYQIIKVTFESEEYSLYFNMLDFVNSITCIEFTFEPEKHHKIIIKTYPKYKLYGFYFDMSKSKGFTYRKQYYGWNKFLQTDEIEIKII